MLYLVQNLEIKNKLEGTHKDLGSNLPAPRRTTSN